jgi:hypothetical protein
MPTICYFPCPFCQAEVTVTPGTTVALCLTCGQLIAVPRVEELHQRPGPEPAAAAPAPSPLGYSAVELPPADVGPRLEVTPAWRDVRLKQGPGESLAVLALLLPLVALCLLYFGKIQAGGVTLAVLLGTVVLTATLLAIDAYRLGRVDLDGRRQETFVILFLGLFLVWPIIYPLAYFRRVRFGRPNYGVLAVLVVLIAVGATLARSMSGEGGWQFGRAPPPCGAREVIQAVEGAWRKNPKAPVLKASRNHMETGYDQAAGVRKGHCVLDTDWGDVRVTYTVSWLNSWQRTFQVQIQEVVFEEPPQCTSRDVVAIVEQMLKEGLNAGQVRGAEAFEETRYDKDSKTRFGACKARTDNGVFPVVFKVKLVDPNKGSFQVQILP